jgi:hypothetical protein
MMLVDCNTCPVRHVRCADCMVTALMTVPHAAHETPRPVLTEAGATGAGGDAPVGLALDRAERHAVSVLLGAGLVSVAEANAARAVPSEPAHPAATGTRHQGHTRSTGSTGPTRATGSSRSARSSRAAG